jgi:hypothetical protein
MPTIITSILESVLTTVSTVSFKNILICVLTSLLLVCGIVIYLWNGKIDTFKKDLNIAEININLKNGQINELNSVISKQNEKVKQFELDKETALKEMPKEVTRIVTKYKNVYVENNATCEQHLEKINETIDIFNGAK